MTFSIWDHLSLCHSVLSKAMAHTAKPKGMCNMGKPHKIDNKGIMQDLQD